MICSFDINWSLRGKIKLLIIVDNFYSWIIKWNSQISLTNDSFITLFSPWYNYEFKNFFSYLMLDDLFGKILQSLIIITIFILIFLFLSNRWCIHEYLCKFENLNRWISYFKNKSMTEQMLSSVTYHSEIWCWEAYQTER